MKKSKYEYKSGKMIIRPTDDEKLWDSKWDIILKTSEETKIGWISFEGKKETGTVPVSIELLPLYRHRGHGTDALRMAREWAFLHKNVYEVEAFADRDDADMIGALNKSGFIYRADRSIEKSGLERYSVIKGKTAWLGIYLAIGVAVGIALGLIIGIQWAGMVISLIISISIGSYLDSNERKRRRQVTEGKL